ncbi:alpha/beta-hydrolase [Phlegmacium glaucopus]|nr:alpha/beta-hydrolase [Phlegmacium glaucopus]
MPPLDTPSSSPAYPDDPLLGLPTAFSTLTCLQRGLCPVSSLRGSQGPELLESHSLYYEVHGSPATAAAIAGDKDRNEIEVSPKKLKNKMVFIMGLNSSCFSWGPQVRWFGGGIPRGSGEGEEEYTALVFDNRGVGNSGYPRGPYTTGAMAEDVICLLDYLGWTADRELNIVGISLGGMIAQELAYRIPNRISSLLLAVTTPGGYIWENFPPWKGLFSLAKLTFTPDPVEKVPTVLEMLFPSKWLDSKAENDDKGRTNRQVQGEAFLTRVTTAKPQRFLGHISQMAAALTHHVSPSRLAFISTQIPKIIIVTGDEDHLVAPEGSRRLCRGMVSEQDKDGKGGQVELVQWEGTGHGIHVQKEREFNELIARCVREGRKLNGITDLGP